MSAADMRRDDPWHLLRILKIAVAAEDAELAADARAALRQLRPPVPAPKQGPARGRLPRLVRPSEVRQ